MITKQFVDGLEVFSCQPEGGATQSFPLLFVHGAFAGGWMWSETFMPYFAAAGFRTYALSLRGHGGSDGHEQLDWYSIADYVDDVAKVMDWLGEAPILVGHSMGGFVVQKALEKHAAPAAALLCSVPPQGLIASQFHLLLQKPQLFLEINNIMAGNYPDIGVVREALFAQEVSDAVLDGFLTRLQSESHRALLDMSMFNLPLLPLLHRPPMLILGAGKDILVPAFLVQATAHTYGLPCRIFHDLGHAVTHEQDWRSVAGALLEWLLGLRP